MEKFSRLLPETEAQLKTQYEGAIRSSRPTNIGDNLDRQISEAKARYEALVAVKDRLNEAKLLGISLDDLRIAMQ